MNPSSPENTQFELEANQEALKRDISEKSGEEIIEDSYDDLTNKTEAISSALNYDAGSPEATEATKDYFVASIERGIDDTGNISAESKEEVRSDIATATFQSIAEFEGADKDPDDTIIGRVLNNNPESITQIDEVLSTLESKDVKTLDGNDAAEAARRVIMGMDGEVSEGGAEKETELNAAEFLEKKLDHQEFIDEEGFKRDTYEIAGRKVIFRNRDDLPNLGEVPFTMPDADIVLPTELTHSGIKSMDLKEYAENSLSPDNESALILTTNTPEGLLQTAIAMGFDKDGSMQQMSSEIQEGRYSKSSIDLIDSIIATTQYNETGHNENFDYTGYAITLAALGGDNNAKEIVNQRKNLLYADTDRVPDEMEDGPNIEPANSAELALVHSTSHPVERDGNGDIILMPSGAKRADKYPRSSVHFTLNGQVTGHIAGDWGVDNTLIVTNLEKAMEKNGAPRTLMSADTYFTMNPGEAMTLPDAVTVKGNENQSELFLSNGSGDITYKHQESYSDSEREEIEKLSTEFNVHASAGEAATVREIALRMAEQSLGVDKFSTIGEWGSEDNNFDASIRELARDIKAGSGPHSASPEGKLEDQLKGSFAEPGGQALEYARATSVGAVTHAKPAAFNKNADLKAVRTAIAAGYAPARHNYNGGGNSSAPDPGLGAF